MPEENVNQEAQSGADVSKQDAAGDKTVAGDGQLEATNQGPKTEAPKRAESKPVGTPARTVTVQQTPTGPDFASMSSSQMAENWEATLEWYKSQV